MINKETYEDSLKKLFKKEQEHKVAVMNGISFMEKYKQALVSAKNENKNILILFHVSGCDGCIVTEYILDNSEILKEQLSNYIILKHTSSEIRTNLPTKFNIYSYPTILIINYEEKIIKQKIECRVSGGPDKHILQWLTTVKS